jgi:hypothetical protein
VNRQSQLVLSRRQLLAIVSGAAGSMVFPKVWAAAEFDSIAPQPYFAGVMRAIAALAEAGQQISKSDADRLVMLAAQSDTQAVVAAEAILDGYTLARTAFDADGVGTAAWGGAKRELIEQGWRSFLIRVNNPAGYATSLDPLSGGITVPSHGEQRAFHLAPNRAPFLEKAWLYYELAQKNQPLSGAPVEYRVIDLFSRDRGERASAMSFKDANGGFSAQLADFVCLPARDIALNIIDHDGIGCMASLIIKDARDHVYPPQVRRIAPDMTFHPQIYRADGENVLLPDGDYVVSSWRGPEYLRQSQRIRISEDGQTIAVKLKRWIDPAQWGWYSGDTHIHNAGCSHYVHPTEGVAPETMIRHVRGEGLAIGSSLNWGPSWYYQRQFFSGHTVSPKAELEHPDLQAANNTGLRPKPTPKDSQSLLRYDVEVSGFPSSLSGHVILLQLKQQDYPGTRSIEDWPSYTLPIMKWAKNQGCLVGYAHCSAGMRTASSAIPNYEIPPFDSIGTNAAIVDITHDACDFLSGCQGQPASELNAWYHMLNCGMRLAMVGETDFPCFYDDRVGMGRSYVQLDQRPMDDAGYAEWLNGIKSGRLYCGDGRSHFLKFTVDGQRLGGADVTLRKPQEIDIRATVAALLDIEPLKNIRTTRDIHPKWHIEYARIENTRSVPVELVVNGQPVERVELVADGKPRPVRFKTRLERSSWVALRILPSGHTHPIFVAVDGKPIRASRRSAEWLRKSVDALWKEKHRLMRESERPAAAEAYDHARRTYDRIIAESELA